MYIFLFCVLIQYNIQLAYILAPTVGIIDDHSEQRNTLSISQNDAWNNSKRFVKNITLWRNSSSHMLMCWFVLLSPIASVDCPPLPLFLVVFPWRWFLMPCSREVLSNPSWRWPWEGCSLLALRKLLSLPYGLEKVAFPPLWPWEGCYPSLLIIPISCFPSSSLPSLATLSRDNFPRAWNWELDSGDQIQIQIQIRFRRPDKWFRRPDKSGSTFQEPGGEYWELEIGFRRPNKSGSWFRIQETE